MVGQKCQHCCRSHRSCLRKYFYSKMVTRKPGAANAKVVAPALEAVVEANRSVESRIGWFSCSSRRNHNGFTAIHGDISILLMGIAYGTLTPLFDRKSSKRRNSINTLLSKALELPTTLKEVRVGLIAL